MQGGKDGRQDHAGGDKRPGSVGPQSQGHGGQQLQHSAFNPEAFGHEGARDLRQPPPMMPPMMHGGPGPRPPTDRQPPMYGQPTFMSGMPPPGAMRPLSDFQQPPPMQGGGLPQFGMPRQPQQMDPRQHGGPMHAPPPRSMLQRSLERTRNQAHISGDPMLQPQDPSNQMDNASSTVGADDTLAQQSVASQSVRNMMQGSVRSSSQSQAQNNNKFDRDDIYLKTPLGQALEEAIDEMELNEEQKQNILEKFHKAVEKQFQDLQKSAYGVQGGLGSQINYSENPQDYAGHSRDNSKSHTYRNKLDSKCKSYKCMFFTWQFQMENFTVTMEDNQVIQAPTCNFWGVPHKEYQMKVHSSNKPNNKKKPNKQQKQMGGGRGGRSGRGGPHKP